MKVLKTGAAGLLVLILIVAPPILLILTIGNPWPPEGVSLSAPLTDNAVLGLIAVVVWILWAQFTLSLIVECFAVITDRAVDIRLPVFGFQQDLARVLVGAIITTVAVAPAIAGAANAADSTSAPDPTATSLVTQPRSAPTTEQTAGPQRAGAAAEPLQVHVERGDTLWSLAEKHLGDGDRWTVIAEANQGQTMVDGRTFSSADHIRPGWVLAVPGAVTAAGAEAAHLPSEGIPEHLVVPGETLSGIALETTGDADNWPSLYEANKDVIDNPDQIYPGQVLVLGGDGASDPSNVPEQQPKQTNRATDGAAAGPERHGDDAGSGRSAGDKKAEQDQEQAAEPVTAISPSQERTQDVPGKDQGSAGAPEVDRVSDDGGITGLRALLATAVCLSAGALALVAANRRRQFRRRRIGRTIASTPDEFVEVEQAIIESGSEAREGVEFLDRALRHVAASCKVADHPLPQLGAAVLGDEDLTLLFTQPAAGEPPEGWTATDDARAWVLSRRTILEPDLETQPAPYPALVSIGQDDGGRTWLLDLETLGRCGIGGAPELVADVARFMVAELAVNAWSEGSEVLLTDQFGAEIIGLNPARLKQVPRDVALARAAVLTSELGEVEQNLRADVLARRREGLLIDSTNPVVVVVSTRPEGDFVADLEDRTRSRIVVVHRDEESPALELASDGMAFLPMWGISVKVFTLPTAEAEAMTALVASTRRFEDEPVPATQSDEGPLGKYAQADGSLRGEFTRPRRAEGNDPSSMLPDADEVYLATAATTAEDLAAAAPSVPEEIRAEIEALDPRLDEDVADWFDESSPRPKVHLLGPVSVTALHGGDPGAIDNAAGTVAFIAYLAVQDHGVTGERAAAACGWKTQKTVQNRASNARFLLGTRPDGSDWLPDASLSAGARRGTSPTYELVRGPGGTLNSADLFVRLKHRALRRGDNGCEEDLMTALSLVTGAPFEAATEYRFKWLFTPGQQRHDEILVGAIHDAAHILATRGVSDGRTDLVSLACDAARKASPHSDITWLDRAAATEAESGHDAAGKLVREQVLDRFDEDLPPRTEVVVEQREWGATG